MKHDMSRLFAPATHFQRLRRALKGAGCVSSSEIRTHKKDQKRNLPSFVVDWLMVVWVLSDSWKFRCMLIFPPRRRVIYNIYIYICIWYNNIEICSRSIPCYFCVAFGAPTYQSMLGMLPYLTRPIGPFTGKLAFTVFRLRDTLRWKS